LKDEIFIFKRPYNLSEMEKAFIQARTIELIDASLVGVGKLHGGIPSNLGGMNIIIHLRKPSIYNLTVAGTIEVPRFSRLEPFTLGGSRFEGRHQLTKVGPPHLEKYFKLLLGE
jgi:hypothetical protein